MRLDRDGYYELPPGKLAAVVTFLEMTSRPAPRPVPLRADLRLVSMVVPPVARYRRLFTRIGRDWLWSSRLMLTDDELTAILADPGVEVHVLEDGSGPIGLLELDFREPREVELVFFGLVPEEVGKGAGRWLMNRAIDLAWRPGIERFWLHTCTYDHPGAVAFYRRSGFTAYKFAVEVGDDPRLAGELPPEAAPQVPLLGRAEPVA